MARTSTNTDTTPTTISAYKFASTVNGLIREELATNPNCGLKELPAQMFYTYKNKGLIGVEGKAPLTVEGATEWFATYKERKITREAAKVAKAEAELKGETTTPTESENVNA